MKQLLVNTGSPYEIKIGRGLLADAGALTKQVSALQKAKRVVIVTDSNLTGYLPKLVRSFREAGWEQVTTHVFEAGEERKTLSTIANFYGAFADAGLTRSDFVVAFGGGVTGDLTGFAAATYLRGIPYVQIPTSLLAQVDSSVGGKTGVDISQGKNLAGAFWQPKLVLIDPNTLSTLSPHFFADGMGEVIKYGCLFSRSLFDQLKWGVSEEEMETIIFQCVDHKRRVVEMDERDTGDRMLLNFGHTLGHALEKAYHFKGLSHGEAVGIGMVMITEAAEAAGYSKPGTALEIAQVLASYGLPVSDDTSLAVIAEGAANDKKALNGVFNLILLKEIGQSGVVPIEQGNLLSFLEGGLSLCPLSR